MTYLKYALLFIIGLLVVAFLHLIIAICVAKSKKTYPKTILWLIAIGSSLLGYIMITVILPAFDWFTGIVVSGIFIVINYFILKKKCSEKKE